MLIPSCGELLYLAAYCHVTSTTYNNNLLQQSGKLNSVFLCNLNYPELYKEVERVSYLLRPLQKRLNLKIAYNCKKNKIPCKAIVTEEMHNYPH